jgi:hypothetical protein
VPGCALRTRLALLLSMWPARGSGRTPRRRSGDRHVNRRAERRGRVGAGTTRMPSCGAGPIATAVVQSGCWTCRVSTVRSGRGASGRGAVSREPVCPVRVFPEQEGACCAATGAAHDTGVLVADQPGPPRAGLDRRDRRLGGHDLEHGLGRGPATEQRTRRISRS